MIFTPKYHLLRIWQILLDDIRRFYAWRNLVRLGVGLLVGALLANLPLDAWLEQAYRGQVHSKSKAAKTFHWVTKQFGDKRVVVLAPVTAMAIGVLAPANPAAAVVGAWGTQMSRTLLVASPVTFGGTWLLGGSRPKEGRGSGWHPLQDENGISGHAMAGAVPFLIMAGMTANPVAQTVLYACSGLTACSRVDSRSHYPSQVLLGWWLAFLGMRVVKTQKQ
jgi:membrane-associated phospholipid phosphatase